MQHADIEARSAQRGVEILEYLAYLRLKIVGGALVLVLAGLSAPATTSAAPRIVGHEVIPVEGEAPEAPWKLPIWMGGHDGTGTSNYAFE